MALSEQYEAKICVLKVIQRKSLTLLLLHKKTRDDNSFFYEILPIVHRIWKKSERPVNCQTDSTLNNIIQRLFKVLKYQGFPKFHLIQEIIGCMSMISKQTLLSGKISTSSEILTAKKTIHYIKQVHFILRNTPRKIRKGM